MSVEIANTEIYNKHAEQRTQEERCDLVCDGMKGGKTMGGRTILHSDANCFYATVEHLHRPELNGEPLAVGGDPESRHGIILTADYIAKNSNGAVLVIFCVSTESSSCRHMVWSMVDVMEKSSR